MLAWGELPDFCAVALLVCAFASVARRSQTPVSKLWLTAWAMIVLHFGASIFMPAPGAWGILAELVALISLIWAGSLFMWASVPYRNERSSPWMAASMAGATTLYMALLVLGPVPPWAMILVAALIGVIPLAIALAMARRFDHPLRWAAVLLYTTLSAFLLLFQLRPGNGAELAMNAVLFTIYLGCCFHFWFAFRRATAGAFVTIAGFLAWASVFCVAPLMFAYWPNVHIESEVWNLPKYVVAVGMILLLLEDQIEHNKYLALHDELTGLPNRRLFLDRLTSALQRARRTDSKAALLLIDLDLFKQVNDTLGHHVGDLLLQHVSSIFVGRVRRSDTVARTGGDEFCIILEEPTSSEDALFVGRSLIQMIREPIQLGGHVVRAGASVGIALFPEDASDEEALCIAADLRMYQDKQSPKGLDELGDFAKKSSLPVVHPEGHGGFQTAL